MRAHRCNAGSSLAQGQRAARLFGKAGITSRPSVAGRADAGSEDGLRIVLFVRIGRTYLAYRKLRIAIDSRIIQIVRHGRTKAPTIKPASHQPDPRGDGRFRVVAGPGHLQDIDPRLCPAGLARTRSATRLSTCDP